MGYNCGIMLKRLVMFLKLTLAIAVVAGAIVLVAYEEHKASDKYQRDCQSHVPAVSPAGNDNNAHSQDECQDPKKYMPWWYVLITWPDGIAVWAVLTTLGAIIWQSNETRRAAEAAYLQAQLTKSKQRAHIAIVSPPDPPSSLGTMFTDQHGKTFEPVEVYIEIILDGESNAYNVRAVGGLSVTEKKDAIFVPEWSKLECPTVIREAPPEKPLRIALAPGGFSTIPRSEMDKVRESDSFLHASGQILYDDVFEDHHVTPFHFVWYVTKGGSWLDEEGWDNLSGKDS